MPIRNAQNYDYRTGHVQDDIYNVGRAGSQKYGFISAETIVLAAQIRHPDGEVPTNTGGQNTYSPAEFIPIGVVENINMAQQKNIQQLFEIGSKDSYFVPGRTIVQLALNRVLLDGDSLMRVMYPVIENSTGSAEFGQFDEPSPLNPTDSPGTTTNAQPDLWFNLASSFLNRPVTLALLFYDDNATPLGNVVLVDAIIESHNLAVAAAQVVITENVRIRVAKIASLSVS